MVSFFFFFLVMERVNRSISVVWCSCPWSPVRMYTGRSVFCIDPPAFVNASVSPPSLERAPVMVVSCSLCPLLVILELSTDSFALSWIMCVTLQFFHSSANSASVTDQKLRKEKSDVSNDPSFNGRNQCVYGAAFCCLSYFWNQTWVKDHFWLNCDRAHKYPSCSFC